MKTTVLNCSPKLYHLFITIFLIWAMPLDVAWGSAAETRRGPAFSDLDQRAKMSADWEKKTIQHIPDYAKVDLVISMNQQLYPMLKPIIEVYAKERNFTVEVQNSTCGKSAGELERKEIDIGSACCPPGQLDRLPGLRQHTMGIIPLTFLVHPTNPVDNISLSRLRDVFQGDIIDWSEVGGTKKPIKMIASIHCKKKPGDWRLLLSDQDMFSPDILETGEMEAMIAFVAQNEDAIGYETPNVAVRFKNRGEVKFLKVNNFDPMDLNNTLYGRYQIYRTYMLTTWEGDNANKHADDLVDYLLKTVTEIDSIVGFIPWSKLKEAGWKFKGNELVGEPSI